MLHLLDIGKHVHHSLAKSSTCIIIKYYNYLILNYLLFSQLSNNSICCANRTRNVRKLTPHDFPPFPPPRFPKKKNEAKPRYVITVAKS